MLRLFAIALCAASVYGRGVGLMSANLLGDVALTTVQCPTGGKTAGTRAVGEDIFGPMEAGFTSAQLTSMFRSSCGTAALDGGIDTATSEVRARARPLPRKLPANNCSRVPVR